MDRPTTTGEGLLELLKENGVELVFGVPGNHTIALYRGFAEAGIRHVTCRHEQGAAFMADGYARATGRPGVCVLISGPGLLNAATAIAQARADSVPMLVISGVAPVVDLGMQRGTLHELPDQHATAASICRTSSTLLDPDNLSELIARAFALFRTQRPGPVHIEIPLDLMEAPWPEGPGGARVERTPVLLGPPGPHPETLIRAAALLDGADRPLIVVGGGAQHAASAIAALAEALDSPVLNTVNGKGVLPMDHPLAVGGSPSQPALRSAMSEADVLLAIGTEMGETDYDLLMTAPLAEHPALIRIDIDPNQLLTPQIPALALVCDAAAGARALADRLMSRALGTGADNTGDNPGSARATSLRAAVRTETHYHPEVQAFFEAVVEAAADAIIVGDSTRPTYYAAWQLERSRPRSYFHSASGFGTLGYALPAAFGAALANLAPVIAIIGDGGIQFTLPELSTAAELELPVPVIVWHNQGYREIENSMRARNVPVDAARIEAPDFAAAASAHGSGYAHPQSLADLRQAIRDALTADSPTLIEVSEATFLTTASGGWYQ